MAPGGRRSNGETPTGQQQQQQQADGRRGCACGGFPVCACAGAAAVASAASSADMDRVAVAATEGQIGAVNDESWVAVDLSDDGLSSAADPGAVALEERPVFRTEKIKGVLLHPYRYIYTYTSSSALSSTASPARRAPAFTGRYTPNNNTISASSLPLQASTLLLD
jgi:mixed-linked glucan synthase